MICTMCDQGTNTHNHKEIQNKAMQSGFKPGHKRSGSDVIDCLGENSVFQDVRNDNSQSHSNVNMSTDIHPTRRKSSDIVDCGRVRDEVDDSTVRPTTLETNGDQKQRTEEWSRSKSSSRDLLDATPISSPETSEIIINDKR